VRHQPRSFFQFSIAGGCDPVTTIFALSKFNDGSRRLYPTAEPNHNGVPGVEWAEGGLVLVKPACVPDYVEVVFVGAGLIMPRYTFIIRPVFLEVLLPGRRRPVEIELPQRLHHGNGHAIFAAMKRKENAGGWKVVRVIDAAWPTKAAMLREAQGVTWPITTIA
jgi:hypothetical protein